MNRAIERAGGVFVRQVGSHRRYRATYTDSAGREARAETAVPQHPGDIPMGTLARIEADLAPAFPEEMAADMTSTARPAYRVNVTRERGVWLADVPDVAGAHTFARSLSALQGSVREVVVLMTDRADDALDAFDLDLRYDIGDSATAVAAARRARADAEQAERASVAAIRQAVARLPVSLSVRDVAELLGISHQRVAQVRAELTGTSRAGGGRHAYTGG